VIVLSSFKTEFFCFYILFVSAKALKLFSLITRNFCTVLNKLMKSPFDIIVEFYLYPTVITALIHLIKPELIR